MDRRGFGASGDGADYSIEREFEDVAAVVDAVAARTGGPVALWGHSFGASVAMGAAALTRNISHLLLYEPSLGLAYPQGWIETVEKALAEGDHEAAIVLVLRDMLEFTDDQIEAMRAGPEWARRVAVAPTVAREARAEQGWVYRPGQFGGITAPTLLLSGSESTPAIKQATDAPRRRSPAPGSTCWTVTPTSRTGRTRPWWQRSSEGSSRRRSRRTATRAQPRSRSCSMAKSAAAARVEVPILA